MSTVPDTSSAPASSPPAKARIPIFTADAWAPLKSELFRSLWIATSIAQVGIWTREAAGPTLMENLTSGWASSPEMVARVLVFSNLPICLFSVFAGALADVLDRRHVLIVTQIWMIAVSTLLGILTFTGHINPAGLLAFTFLLGVGTAAFGPALQAVLPELVPKPHFALAINMNSIALNVARALGPALFILVVHFVPGDRGAGLSFILSAVSFVGALWVLYRWRRPPQRAAVHGEQMWSAIRAGFRYTVYSPANRAILLRVLTFIVPAVVIWSQVPIIAKSQLGVPKVQIQEISALLFAFVGMGAILGVFLMPGLHARYHIDPVVNVCTALFALGLIALSYVHVLWLAGIILIFLGVNWVIIPTNFNTATQKSVPLWVKGRAISFYLTVLFGSFAIGGAIWGRVTTHSSIHVSLLLGGLSMLAFLVLARWFPLTLNEGKDLTVAYQGPPSELPGQPPAGTTGPVQVRWHYRVTPNSAASFHAAMRQLRLQRLRNGGWAWQLDNRKRERDDRLVFIESYTFSSWDEHVRHFSRLTKSDLEIEQTAAEYRAHPAPAFAPAPPNSEWLRDRVADSFDRIIDEIFIAYDRFSQQKNR